MDHCDLPPFCLPRERRLSMKKQKNDRRGSTLVELMAAMGLMCLVMTMAAGCMLTGGAVLCRIERGNHARILLDQTLALLQEELENACGYIKIYESGLDTADREGTLGTGRAIEYLDAAGCPTLYTTEGCADCEIPEGVLIRRSWEPVGRGADTWEITAGQSCGEMIPLSRGLFLQIEYSFTEAAGVLITAEVSWRQEMIARQERIVSLRHEPPRTTAVTAVNGK